MKAASGMYILDSNVIAELIAHRPHSAVYAWASSLNSHQVYTSAIAVAETLAAVASVDDGRRMLPLLNAVETLFNLDFADRVLDFNVASGPHYAWVMANQRQLGKSLTHSDAQVAAIALQYEACLVTASPELFQQLGLQLLNPWDFYSVHEQSLGSRQS